MSKSDVRVSSFCDRGDCVEVEFAPDGSVVVRSTGAPGEGASTPGLEFTRQEWTAFLLGVKAGEFDPV